MRHCIDQCFSERLGRHKVTILAEYLFIRLETPQTLEPSNPFPYLLFERSSGVGDLQYLSSPIIAFVGNALYSKVTCLRVTLRLLAKSQNAI